MTAEEFSELLAAEEAKRDRCTPPAQRWRALMQAIADADSQQPVPRNSKRRCLELQAEKLAQENAT